MQNKIVNNSLPSHQITPKACMESATCCGMELRRSRVWNHHEVMYGIKPQEMHLRWCHTPSAITYTLRVITYQSFGLDKKRASLLRSSFFGARDGTWTRTGLPHAPQTCASADSATLASALILYHRIWDLSTPFFKKLNNFWRRVKTLENNAM